MVSLSVMEGLVFVDESFLCYSNITQIDQNSSSLSFIFVKLQILFGIEFVIISMY